MREWKGENMNIKKLLFGSYDYNKTSEDDREKDLIMNDKKETEIMDKEKEIEKEIEKTIDEFFRIRKKFSNGSWMTINRYYNDTVNKKLRDISVELTDDELLETKNRMISNKVFKLTEH